MNIMFLKRGSRTQGSLKGAIPHPLGALGLLIGLRLRGTLSPPAQAPGKWKRNTVLHCETLNTG